jgi:hypothetical protein
VVFTTTANAAAIRKDLFNVLIMLVLLLIRQTFYIGSRFTEKHYSYWNFSLLPCNLRPSRKFLLVPCIFFCIAASSQSYSVFTHELLIDLTWKTSLEPLLKSRFPAITTSELRQAHAYAYGGCAIQDLGYYPFNNEFFSDLTHYVRSGDFIAALLRDSRNANEYAFALGAMSHYFGDNIGHHYAVNPSTAIGFPTLEQKYGPLVTYDENPHAHVRTEFAFDIEQLAKARMAPRRYLESIGLRVPTHLLAQAFEETYSLPLRQVDKSGKPIVRSYRFAVRSFLPRIAYAETLIHRKSFLPDTADPATQTFLASLKQADFESTWTTYRRNPAMGTYALALLIRLLPKIGILSELAIKIPTLETQQLYIASVNRAVESYRAALTQPTAALPNRDLDTGAKTKPGAYPLTDQTYAHLLRQLTAHPTKPIEPALKTDILDFYSDPTSPITTKKNPKAWKQVQANLAKLR